MTEFQTFYGTFGQGHLFKNHYVRIEAPEKAIACRAMAEQFPNWSNVYDEERWTGFGDSSEMFPGGEIFAVRVLDEHLNYQQIKEPTPRCPVCHAWLRGMIMMQRTHEADLTGKEPEEDD